MKNNIKNLIADILQEESILEGMTQDQVKRHFTKKPDVINGEEWIYIIEKYFFGLLTRKLHLYFHQGKVRDYYVG
ncbi:MULTISPECIES: hypothetical protein [Chryseobacterium]|uniref:hypothetical protein n=1 Tax=Chryseobacterium TaxID=59732 RepID=UPI00195B7670|nr:MULTISPECIES: hypothetical protein [Chryseobacterium]MBM7420244.1 hypothetical protein [Chryseobacterium sp. JUb44]MDH6210188.1 hypothetical protein [Chryseobacterium sp. BIGb0186]WSO08907.1 hypothetical protein VUJ64_13845 [Chryseobacterium scophthalmum]